MITRIIVRPSDIAVTVEVITPAILKRALACWQQGRELPDALLNLQLLSDVAAPSRIIRSIWLYDYIYEVGLRHLKACREAMAIPHPDNPPVSCEAIKAQLSRDFDTGDGSPSPELMAWSALFHRYLLPIRIPAWELAEAAGISDRHMRRQLRLGFAFLARALRRAELSASMR